LINSQHITTAAAMDQRNYRARDARCSQGPIPVQCQSCSCGTCWVGVLGGADRLSPVQPNERAKLAECGYIDTSETHPPIRLACQAQGFGRVSLVIPPWNGVITRARSRQ
jgi:ferredoxin